MNKEDRKKYPCFCFEQNIDSLFSATMNASLEIGPVIISDKDLDSDLNSVIQSSNEALVRNGICIIQRVIYEDNNFLLSTVLHHIQSGEKYEKRDLIIANKDNHIEFERSVKYLKINAYINFIGLDVVNEENYISLLDISERDVNKISLTDIKKFFECPRCFYFSRKGIKLPFQSDDRFVYGKANDGILKKEFDECRRIGKCHPIMKKEHLEAIPLKNSNINKWKESNYGNGGIKFFDKEKNCIFIGVVDDIWINQQGKFIIVDYKTTSKDFITLEDEQGVSYVRQLSFYAWLFKKNGYSVHSVGYLIFDKPQTDFKYCMSDVYLDKVPRGEYSFNPYAPVDEYKRILEFETLVVPVPIEDSWVDGALDSIIECLNNEEPPKPFRNKRTNKPCSTCEFYFRLKMFEDRLSKK
ncbi:MAG: hypothetical protein UR12_C0021G0001 [candidate division TM6 bacterium GW2011_GWF2_30_66]|nr:MAG: hypothetical protein UR12_C0021G0001 [candidate division TM6 bacterium GW2011_GWF2_30_66]